MSGSFRVWGSSGCYYQWGIYSFKCKEVRDFFFHKSFQVAPANANDYAGRLGRTGNAGSKVSPEKQQHKSISDGNNRITEAKKYDKQYKYSLERKSGTFNCADFVAKVMIQTDYDIAKYFVDKNGNSSVKAIIDAINKNLAGEIREDNPKVGDLVIWYNEKTGGGHVEFISYVDGDKVLIYGASSGDTPKETGQKNGYIWLDVKGLKTRSSWNGTFKGFWTP